MILNIAQKVTDSLGGYGVFGVELFIKGDEVYFSEVSPRPFIVIRDLVILVPSLYQNTLGAGALLNLHEIVLL